MATSKDSKGIARTRTKAAAAGATRKAASGAKKAPKAAPTTAPKALDIAPPHAPRQRAAASAAGESASAVPAAPDLAALTAFDPQVFDTWTAEHLHTGASLRRGSRGDGPGAGGGALDAAALARPNAVLEVHFADGSVFYTAPADFVREHAAPPFSTRGGGAHDAIVLPFELASSRLPRSRAAASASAVERYAISELTAPTTLDHVFNVAETFRQIGGRWAERWLGLGADANLVPMAVKLCGAFENSSLDPSLGTRGGVLLLWRDGAWAPLSPCDRVSTGAKPLLLLLHGTASSTAGSFGKLWTAPNGGGLPGDFEALADSHTLLGWDHRSLTLSPIDNTIELVDALLAALPQACRVDVMSHSRGGLVGELFALRTAAGLDGARAAFALHFAPAPSEPAHPDHERIDDLFDALSRAAPRCTPGSFVRVACPTRGTLLADGRTDLFLSLMLRAVGLATSGLGTIVFDRFTALVKSLVAARADAKGLPGIEAMVPGSPLTLALARCEAQPTDRLRVVAGDAAARGLSGLLTLVADVFYGWHDHDFVVHTRSMFGGLKRVQAARSLRWEHHAVSHFAYFAAGNPSRSALLGALAGRDDGFASMADDERQTRGNRGLLQALKSDPLARRDFSQWQTTCNAPEQARRPVLVVLAGIMGSELKRAASGKDSPVWLSVGAMVRGQVHELQLQGPDDARLEASGLLAISYERLLEEASKRYNVLSFPFDWRRPIAESGARLVERIAEVVDVLTDRSVPVHLVVHSMGGLVARHALFVDETGKTLWTELKRRDSRLLMLGTPNKGAYAPAQLLCGQHSMSQMLGLLARKVSGKSLSRYGAAFPGLIQMLPQAADAKFGNLFDPVAWDAIAKSDSAIVRPDAQVLADARAYIEGKAFQDSFDALCNDPRAFYVAGIAETPLQMRPTENPWGDLFGDAGGSPDTHGVEFMAGPGGDGTVPWSSTLKPERTWYAPCDHGTLPDHRESFEAYFELLDIGDTRKLQRQPPRARSAGAAIDADAERLLPLRGALRPALLPTTDLELAEFILQQGSGAAGGPATPEPIEVRVVHGGLDYARYPLMVGHYLNDAPSGAVKRVDEKLDGQLQRLLDWKLFVGAARTAHYLRPNNHGTREPAYRGAILLGLGSVGEMTPGSLAETVTRGVLRYAFEHIHRDPYAPAGHAPVELRLSSVLVGTQIQAVTVRDALGGIVLGVWRAAQLLLQMGGERVVRIRELEIVEIDEHTALDTAYEMRRLLERGEWAERLHWAHPVLETREGSICGYRLRTRNSTWQRLVVRQDALGGLNFALIGERARVESTQVYSDVASLRRFIDRVSDDRAETTDRIAGATDPALGGVLFQMLLPLELKSRLANLDNTVLVLDDDTARYPWELLTPPATSAAEGETPQPFVVHAGLVRQRVTQEFRQLPQAISGHHALIVGAPSTEGWTDERGAVLGFNDLPGARAEAHAVDALLRRDGRPWQTTPLISPAPREGKKAAARLRRDAVSFEQVRVALLERPYRLVHLCGHGVVDQFMRRIGPDGDGRNLLKTGMLLSDQEVLGAADVEQMSPAPEFVFINCCYSGRDGEALPGASERRTRQDAVLASSLALKFIDMGARAVIAAGWQVDDAAALLFAEAFYERLLDGVPFGEAVKGARAEVYTKHGLTNNTWGAYQCYGDPTWALTDSGVSHAGDAAGTSRLRAAEDCMSPGELAARIGQVAAVAGDKPPAAVLAQLDHLIDALQRDPERESWVTDSRVRAALGVAYRELGDHAKAARYFQLGARTAYSEVQIGQLDMLVSSLASEGSTEARRAAVHLLEKLNRIGEDVVGRWPLDGQEPGEPTAASERLSLQGVERLREATQLLAAGTGDVPGAQQIVDAGHALGVSADHFVKAYLAKCKERAPLDRRTFALSNTLLSSGLAILLGGAACDAVRTCIATLGEETWLGEASKLLGDLHDADDHGTFWRQATLLELHISRGLFARTLGKVNLHEGQDISRVRELIDAVLVRWPSPIQLECLRHRFVLMQAVCRHGTPSDPTLHALAGQLDALSVEALELLQPRYGRMT